MTYPSVDVGVEQVDIAAQVTIAAVIDISSNIVERVSVIVRVDGGVKCHADDCLEVGNCHGDEEHEPENQVHSHVCARDHGTWSAESHGDIGNRPDEGDAERDEQPPAEGP